MSDRGVYALIEQVVRDGKRRIGDVDRALISQLIGMYQEARHSIAAELVLLEEQILWSIANNPGEVTEAWIRRQEWYQQLDRAIEVESNRLEASTRQLTVEGRAAGIAEGNMSGIQTVQAAPGPGFNPRAVERWTSAIQPGSPLDRVLSRYGSSVEETLRREITQGLIQGQGSSNITRSIIADVGEFIQPYDASRIVRTETMRAYRGAYRDQLDALPADMIAGYRWIAALDGRTCPICIGMHNQVFEEYPDWFHIQCRCTVVPVFSSRYAPPPVLVTGDEWLRQQSEARQRELLGPSRFDVWSSGVPLMDMIQVERDPVWGGSTRLIPVRSLRP